MAFRLHHLRAWAPIRCRLLRKLPHTPYTRCTTGVLLALVISNISLHGTFPGNLTVAISVLSHKLCRIRACWTFLNGALQGHGEHTLH